MLNELAATAAPVQFTTQQEWINARESTVHSGTTDTDGMLIVYIRDAGPGGADRPGSATLAVRPPGAADGEETVLHAAGRQLVFLAAGSRVEATFRSGAGSHAVLTWFPFVRP
ncbi:hypothetical protein [Streptomyces paludis]|uniref:Uncharacterized protein n=1 Tax=Streptomyces paludis TaxID=2282738 RepID=A0A345HS21_9ACTN|nr:hypothetical protein [Streptomyces paludis]AXG79495.1 hypothetical protein DVK44_19635 [Streptomyces paludis]